MALKQNRSAGMKAETRTLLREALMKSVRGEPVEPRMEKVPVVTALPFTLRQAQSERNDLIRASLGDKT
jgi:hypothetical protein